MSWSRGLFVATALSILLIIGAIALGVLVNGLAWFFMQGWTFASNV